MERTPRLLDIGRNLGPALALLISVAAAPAGDEPSRRVDIAIEDYRRRQQVDLHDAHVQPAHTDDSGWFGIASPPARPAAAAVQSAADRPYFLCTGFALDAPESQPVASPSDSQLAPEHAESDSEELAKKLSNPIAALISVPFQSNFNFGGGVDLPSRHHPLGSDDRGQAFKYLLNFQPVIPFSISEDWNLISRTILPIVAQDDVLGTTSQGGLGDTVQSLFFSPKSGEPFIWGVGPVFLLPTSTDHNLLGSYRWGLGPTGVILKQEGPWTVGMLANQIWGFQRDDGRKNVNATFLQPFIVYTFKTATSLVVNTESTYDWTDKQWNVPLFAGVGQIVKIGKLPVQFQLGGQYWVAGPESAPDWSLRFNVTFLFPK